MVLTRRRSISFTATRSTGGGGWAKKGCAFDAVALDPPTFSQSKEHGVFRAEKDYGKLVTTALPLVKPGGVLFDSTNATDYPPESFPSGLTRKTANCLTKAGI